jgi:hypothetical protein
VLLSNARLNTCTKIVCGEQLVQIDRNLGQRKRVVIASNAMSEIPQQTILWMVEA